MMCVSVCVRAGVRVNSYVGVYASVSAHTCLCCSGWRALCSCERCHVVCDVHVTERYEILGKVNNARERDRMKS